jgi:hypothetical protein
MQACFLLTHWLWQQQQTTTKSASGVPIKQQSQLNQSQATLKPRFSLFFFSPGEFRK